MGAKLESTEVKSCVYPKDLKDGQIAIVIGSQIYRHIGSVVQRVGKNLITIGKSEGSAWNSACVPDSLNTLELRVLKDGEKIIVENNQR